MRRLSNADEGTYLLKNKPLDELENTTRTIHAAYHLPHHWPGRVFNEFDNDRGFIARKISGGTEVMISRKIHFR